jgi:hypothetical protein
MAFRFLVCLVVASSIAFAAVPRPAPPPESAKTDCCAKMKSESSTRECDRHAPKSAQDQECCALCSIGLALFVNPAAPFVYPLVGNETFAAYISSEHSRSQRPPVPPPRV